MRTDSVPAHSSCMSVPETSWGAGGLLAVLAVVLFLYLTAEIFTVGALPQMSAELGVSAGQVGQLLTIYAVVAAVSILPAAWVTRRINYRGLLIAAVLLLAITSTVVAAAPHIVVVALARGVTAVAHGVVWAGVPVVAARIAGPGRAGHATSLVFLGSSIGGVAGAPLVAAISHLVSWRAASALLAVLACGCAVALVKALPSLPRQHDAMDRTEHRRGPRIGMPAVAVWCLLTVLVAGAHHLAYPYLSVIAAAWGVRGTGWTVFLLAFGAAGVAGTLLMGRVNDKAPVLSVAVVLAILSAALMGAATATAVLGVLLCVIWSAAYATAPVAFQSGVIRDAPGWSDAASSLYVLAFQIGIATGTWWGGRIVDTTGTDTALLWASGVSTAAVLLLLLTAVLRRRKAKPVGSR